MKKLGTKAVAGGGRWDLLALPYRCKKTHYNYIHGPKCHHVHTLPCQARILQSMIMCPIQRERKRERERERERDRKGAGEIRLYT